jgi:molecular chaperone GrpE (heat shock protein)
MRNPLAPKLTKWPFFAGNALLLGTAGFIAYRTKTPPGLVELLLGGACVIVGALLWIAPFVLEYLGVIRAAEAGALGSAVSQIQGLESVAAQIAGATSRWQTAQEEAEKTVAAAKSIAERMTAEAKSFTEFMQRTNDAERANLRLEVEKLRRVENEWLQTLVRMLDHVFALHVGALRSGQPRLIEQITNFQNACRDAARRVGLTPFTPEPAEPFDSTRHQLFEGNGSPPTGATIGEIIASGYTFQGRMLRPALVRLNGNGAAHPSPDPTPDPQAQLPLPTESR